MSSIKQVQLSQGITLLGLGPGDPGMLTREALDWMEGIEEIYLRTRLHPTVESLPDHLVVKSFDNVYERFDAFEDVYEAIVVKVLELGEQPAGVTYAVPGHPFVAEATCPEILKRAREEGLPIRVIHGVSFLEPTFNALELDPFQNLVLVDAMRLSMNQTPGFSPSMPALIAQIYSRSISTDVKLTLMAAYPDTHPVRLVHGAGTKAETVEDLPLYAIDRNPHLGLLSSLFVPTLSEQASFESFQEIIALLRAPNGCPWDREQTHHSLRPFLLEEAYETLDALDREDMTALQEELGDLLLQVVLHAQIATEEGDFNIHDVIQGIGTKLIRRHPHVFSKVQVENVSGVIRNWEAIKAEERHEKSDEINTGLLNGIPKALPALSQAQAVIDRVGRVNFGKLREKGDPKVILQTLKTLEQTGGKQQANLLGELLLSVSSLAYQSGIDAESALRESLARFRFGFSEMESYAAANGKTMAALSSNEKADLWQQTGDAKNEGMDLS
ncbi:MAG: nucleoside triphosphate pyrophosphohydrolase [Chloroflexota bacterium]|nr:nucleoside triphosphate pyrophosphohydrolase [Chloroflexota bacterium]